MRGLVALMAMLVLAPLAVRGEEVPGGKIVYSRKVGDRYLLHLMNADGKEDRELPGQTAAVNLFIPNPPFSSMMNVNGHADKHGREKCKYVSLNKNNDDLERRNSDS